MPMTRTRASIADSLLALLAQAAGARGFTLARPSHDRAPRDDSRGREAGRISSEGGNRLTSRASGESRNRESTGGDLPTGIGAFAGQGGGAPIFSKPRRSQ